MHLRDERVYDFNDSVYAKLESCRAIALELHPDTAYKSLFDLAVNARPYFSLPGDLVVNPEGFIRNAPWDLELFSHKFDDERNPRPTFLDAYFYEVGRRSGRKVIGIEHFKEQWDLNDFDGQTIDIQNLYGSLPKLLGMLRYRNLIDLYQDANIGKIEEYTAGLYTDEFYKALLTDRNVRMADRLDSIMHNQPTFVAVGCGHLPGDSGLIDLLSAKGYLVNPVMAEKSQLPEPASLAKAQSPWAQVSVPGFHATFEVPYPPVSFNYPGIPSKVFMYPDIGTGLYYYVFGLPVPISEDTAVHFQRIDSLAQLLIESAPGKELRQKDFEQNGRSVHESLLETEKGTIIQRIILEEHRWIVQIVKSQNRKFNRSDVQHFFKSLSFSEPEVKWQHFEVPEELIAVDFPGVPERYSPSEALGERAWEDQPYQSFRTVDPTTGLSFAVSAIDQGQQNKHAHYSSQLSVIDNQLNRVFDEQLDHSYALRTQGEPSINAWYTGHFGTQIVRTVLYGNRIYYLSAGVNGQDSSDAMHFFESVRFRTAPSMKWHLYSHPRIHFTTPFPCDSVRFSDNDKRNWNWRYRVKTEKEKEEETELAKNYTCTCRDSASFRRFRIEVDQLNPLDYYVSDSAFYTKFLNLEMDYEDSIAKEVPWKVGELIGRQYWIESDNEEYGQRIGLLAQGDRLFILTTEGRKRELEGFDNDSFFDDFSLVNAPDSGNPFANPWDEIITILQHEDSDSARKALPYLNSFPIDSSHFEDVKAAILTHFPSDEENNWSILQALLSNCYYLEALPVADFLIEQYDSLPELTSIRGTALTLIGRGKLPKHVDFVFHQLSTDSLPEPDSYYSSLNPIFYQFNDTLEIFQEHYQEFLSLLSKPKLVNRVLYKSMQLLDSGLISQDTLIANQQAFFTHLDWELYYRDTSENYHRLYHLINNVELIGKLNPDKKVIGLLQQLAKDSNDWLASSAIVSLLELGKPIDKKRLYSMAADNEFRIELLEKLQEIDRTDLFPDDYRSMEYLAESYLYSWLIDDYNVDKLALRERVEYDDGDSVGVFYVYEASLGYYEGDSLVEVWMVKMEEEEFEAFEISSFEIFYSEEEFSALEPKEHIRRVLYPPKNPYLLE